MPADLILQQTPEDLALAAKREQLASVRTRLAEREAELTRLRTQLRAFEGRYLQQVGVLYAELDELEARLAAQEAELHDSDAARQRAVEARQRAEESHEAAFGTAEATEEPDDPDPPPGLKALFRELAKRIHPDLARDEPERRYLHVLMARANHAYSRGDADLLQRLLDDYRELSAAAGESAAAESLRITRQIQHAERDLSRMEAERQALLGGETAQLFSDAEDAARDHRDLLAELAAGLRVEIAGAQQRLGALDPQGAAHAG